MELHVRISLLDEAIAAKRELSAALDATEPVMDVLPKTNIRSQVKAEQIVFVRRQARTTAAGHIDNAVMHLQRGTRGTDDLVRLLQTDIAKIGNGEAPILVGDVRAHAKDAVRQLTKAVEQKAVTFKRGMMVAIAAGAAILGWSLLNSFTRES